MLKRGKLEEDMKTTKKALKELGTINVEQFHVKNCGIEKAIQIAVANKLNKDFISTSRIVIDRVAKEIFTNNKYITL